MLDGVVVTAANVVCNESRDLGSTFILLASPFYPSYIQFYPSLIIRLNSHFSHFIFFIRDIDCQYF